jgi:hypothetical protein
VFWIRNELVRTGYGSYFTGRSGSGSYYLNQSNHITEKLSEQNGTDARFIEHLKDFLRKYLPTHRTILQKYLKKLYRFSLSKRSDPDPTLSQSSRSDRIHNTAARYLVRIFPNNVQVMGSIPVRYGSLILVLWVLKNEKYEGWAGKHENLGVCAYISGLVLSPGQRTAATCAVGTLTEQSTSPFTKEKSSDAPYGNSGFLEAGSRSRQRFPTTRK